MKKVLIIFTGVLCLVFIVSVCGYSGSGKMNDPTGTWYGGSYNPDNEGYKYQYTFIPSKGRKFFAMADGAYNPDSLGAAVATTWTGELIQNDSDNYEIRLISLVTGDPVEPPEELPRILAVRGDVQFEDSDTLTIRYTWFAVYPWDGVPFVDEPAVWMLKSGEGPIVETIRRMPVRSTLPAPPEM